MSAPLCFLDTETTSLDPERRLAWEFAAIRRNPTGHQEKIQIFIDVDLKDADPMSLKIGGYYDRHPFGRRISSLHLSDQMSVTSPMGAYGAARQIARTTHGAHLVGMNPSFDAETLGKLLRSQGLTPGWHYHLVDVEAMALGYLQGKGCDMPSLPWKSDDLAAALGVSIPDTDRHTAMGDVRLAMHMYDKMIGEQS